MFGDGSLTFREFMMREPLRVDAEGWLVLGDAPGMGYDIDAAVLKNTRLA